MFSAGLIAHVEAGYDDDHTRNQLCGPVPHPNTDLDWLDTTLAEQRNEIGWFANRALMKWLVSSRLNLMRGMSAALLQQPDTTMIEMVTAALQAANDKLESMLADTHSVSSS